MTFPNSGVIPYCYTGPYPLVLGPNDCVGFSGVIIEQAMWVLMAEYGRYLNFPRATFSPAFQAYRHPSGIPGFETPFGKTYEAVLLRDERGDYALSELDILGRYFSGDLFQPATTPPPVTSSGMRAGKHAMPDIINDMRSYMSGIPFTFGSPDPGFPGLFQNSTGSPQGITVDCDHNALRDWLATKGHPGGQLPWDNVSWTREYYPFNDEIPPGFLGASGIIYDIDFDEVYYQPYPRLRGTAGKTLGMSEQTVISRVTPIFPAFVKTDGTVISVTSRDITRSNEADFNYAHMASGYMRVDGDVLLNYGEYIFNQATAATFAESGIRYTNGGVSLLPAQPAINRVFVDPPALAQGQHDFFVRNTSLPIESGTRISSKENAADAFDGALWFNITSDETGMVLISPISGEGLFVRFAESLVGAAELTDNTDMHRFSASKLVSLYENGTGQAAFINWDHDLDETSTVTAAVDADGNNITLPPGARFFWRDSGGGSFLYPSLASGTNLHHWTGSSFTMSDAVIYEPQGIDVTEVRAATHLANSNTYTLGFNDGGTNYMAAMPANATTATDRSAASGFAEVRLVVGSPNGWSLGDYAELDASAVGLDMPCQPISIEVVDSTAGPVTAGVWCMFREVPTFTPSTSYIVPSVSNPNPDIYVGRISLTGGKWVVQELYASGQDINDINNFYNTTDAFPARAFRPSFVARIDF
jgi:hypothetical protein